MRLALTTCVVLLCLGFTHTAGFADIEAHEYLQTIGDKQLAIHWCAEMTDTTRLHWTTREENSVIETSGRYDTTAWKGTNHVEKTTISAVRRDNTIVIEGMLRGKPISRTVVIDDAPWFQSMSWSLRQLVLSDADKLEFWTLRPDKMEEYKMVARKKGETAVSIGGREVQAIKLELRLKGMLSPFWHSTYWYRKSDAVWMRYEGPSGPPGDPMIIIEYRQPSAICHTSSQRKLNALPEG